MKRSFVSSSLLMSFFLSQAALALEEPKLVPETLSEKLAAGESLAEHKTLVLPESVMPPRADIVFVMDLTGSMSGALDQVKAGAVAMMNKIAADIPDVRFGVASHMDYPGSYSSCGYDASYGTPSLDYPYKLNQNLTTDKPAVQAAINSLALGNGDDWPEDYARVLHELYADLGIGWRDGAKKIVIFWNDSVPHSCNVALDCTGLSSYSTGADPGRDATAGTADDLDLQAVLGSLSSNNISLIALHNGSSFDYWKCYSEKTGGSAFQLNYDGSVPDGTDVPSYVASIVKEEAKHIGSMTLNACTDGFEEWLDSVEPIEYKDIYLDHEISLDYDIKIKVPEGTLPGRYVFTVCAEGDGAKYAGQSVIIEVEKPVIEVPVDIHPASCPNPVNFASKGFVPVAILGTPDFDASTIDPATISIFGVKATRWAIEDVATPYYPFIGKSKETDCNAAGKDGYNDLTLKFDKKDLLSAFGNVEDRQVLAVQIAGQLKKEFDAKDISGEDVIRVIKKKKAGKKLH